MAHASNKNDELRFTLICNSISFLSESLHSFPPIARVFVYIVCSVCCAIFLPVRMPESEKCSSWKLPSCLLDLSEFSEVWKIVLMQGCFKSIYTLCANNTVSGVSHLALCLSASQLLRSTRSPSKICCGRCWALFPKCWWSTIEKWLHFCVVTSFQEAKLLISICKLGNFLDFDKFISDGALLRPPPLAFRDLFLWEFSSSVHIFKVKPQV